MFRHADPREEDLERIASTPGVTVVDHSVSRAMLLEASEDAVGALRDQPPDSVVAHEVTYPGRGQRWKVSPTTPRPRNDPVLTTWNS